MSVSKRTRFEVFKRDRFICQYCGRHPPDVVLQVDHVIPKATGGPDDIANLVTACVDCNSGKSDKPLNEAPEATQERMERQKELAAQVKEYRKWVKDSRASTEKIVDDLSSEWCNGLSGGDGYQVCGQRRLSLKLFLSRMPLDCIYEAMDTARLKLPANVDRDEGTWKYFCGICWHTIREAEGT